MAGPVETSCVLQTSDVLGDPDNSVQVAEPISATPSKENKTWWWCVDICLAAQLHSVSSEGSCGVAVLKK